MKINIQQLSGFTPMDLIPFIALRNGVPISKKRLEVSWMSFSLMIYWGE